MFWKYNSSSSVVIDSLLQQKNVSLQDLMEEEELLQECKAQNKKVIDFLTQPEVLKELVLLLVTDPSPDRELQMRFKYANLASELLTCDVPAIVDKVASSSNLLLLLYEFLENEKPLNPLLASFVSKVFGMLVQRRSEQVFEFLKSRGDFVEVAVKHIGTSAVMDLLSKLICGVDDDDQEMKRGIHQWLNECHLIEQLVEKLSPDCDSEEHSSVDQLLCEIIATGQDTSNNGSDSQGNGSQSRLLTTLESKEVINKLMDIVLHEDRNESSVSHVINILLTLLSYKGSHKESNLSHMSSVELINPDSLESRSTFFPTIISRLPDLQKILAQPTKLGALTTAYGMEVERLGSTRLKVVALIAALIATQDIHVHTEMASLQTLHLLFDLFFKFSLNNFLHTQVTHCVTCVLTTHPLRSGIAEVRTEQIDGLNNNPLNLENGEGGMVRDESSKKEETEEKEEEAKGENEEEDLEEFKQHPLLRQLFSECNIIQKILECYSEEEEEEDLPSVDKVVHNMVGYMGHLREIANTIVESSKEGVCSDLILKEMKKLPNDVITQWEDFALITLAELNLKNKIIPLQMSGVSQVDSDAEDSEEEFFSVESLVILNQSFRDGDMDNISGMRFVDDFKLTDEDGFKLTDEEGMNGSQRLSSQMASSSDTPGMNVEESLENRLQKFEDLVSERSSDLLEFDDMWKDRERNITFGSVEKPEEEENPHSSSEEEGDFDDEFDTLRSTDEKMDVDFASDEWGHWLHSETMNTSGRKKEWSCVFDKRGNALNVDAEYNPWQSAPASETAGNNSWADFRTSSFPSTHDPFVQADSQNGSNNFSTFPPPNFTGNCPPSQPPPNFAGNCPTSQPPPNFAGNCPTSQPPPNFTGNCPTSQPPPNFTGNCPTSQPPPNFAGNCPTSQPPPNFTGNCPTSQPPPNFTGNCPTSQPPPNFAGNCPTSQPPPNFAGNCPTSQPPPNFAGNCPTSQTPPNFTGNCPTSQPPPNFAGNCPTSQPPPGFQADFANVLFGCQEVSAGTESSFPVDFGQESFQSDSFESTAATNAPTQGHNSSGSESLQVVCDVSQVDESRHQNVVSQEDALTSEFSGTVSIEPVTPSRGESDAENLPGESKYPASSQLPSQGGELLPPGDDGVTSSAKDQPPSALEGGSPEPTHSTHLSLENKEGGQNECVGELTSAVLDTEEASTVPPENISSNK